TAPVKGATLVVVADRAIEAPVVMTNGTGWVCGAPQMNWADGLLFATSRFTCQYFANGNDGPLVFDYNVAQRSELQVTLTAPAGTADISTLDNSVELVLRP
ncbi:MAG: hypothetical protein JWQ74_1869, partial [Marmoricola sp.]|nr:hypothetical protein [Marmoricola sp.]